MFQVVHLGEHQRPRHIVALQSSDVTGRLGHKGTLVQQRGQRIHAAVAGDLALADILLDQQPDDAGNGIDERHVLGVPATCAATAPQDDTKLFTFGVAADGNGDRAAVRLLRQGGRATSARLSSMAAVVAGKPIMPERCRMSGSSAAFLVPWMTTAPSAPSASITASSPVVINAGARDSSRRQRRILESSAFMRASAARSIWVRIDVVITDRRWFRQTVPRPGTVPEWFCGGELY